MKLLDLTLPTPAENLALDEALLEWCEAGECSSPVLRFWEPAEFFVVLGYANRVASEVNLPACQTRGVPILRRCSGGGTVLQGPGSMDYALVLPIEPATAGIPETNRQVLEKHAGALSTLLRKPVSVQGHSDLSLGTLKFSGNSQRRKRRWLLFHGTFLLGLDLRMLEDLLCMPSRQPPYRANRRHAEFLTTIPAGIEDIKKSLASVWGINSALGGWPKEICAKLVAEKYSKDDWNLKW